MQKIKITFSQLMIVVLFLFMAVFIFSGYSFYTTTTNNKKQELAERAYLLSTMISSVAKFDTQYSNEKEFNFDTYKATLSQIIDAFKAKDLTMEYLVAAKIDSKIVYQAYSQSEPPSVNYADKNLAVPMRKALEGGYGVIVESDYNGSKVFAAYIKIEGTPWGLVIKQPYFQYILPYIRTLLVTIIISMLFLFAIYFSIHTYNLQQINLQKINQKLQKSIDLFGEHVITSDTDLDGRITYVSNAFL